MSAAISSRCYYFRHLPRFSHFSQRSSFSDDASEKLKLYKALGVKSNATHSEIKQAYYDLTFRYHPDRNKGSVEAAEKFREVSEAYEILGDHDSRKMYDKGIPTAPTFIKSKVRDVIEEKDIQYQKFYDSRTADRSRTYAHSYKEEKKGEQGAYKSYNERFEEVSSPGVQAALFGIFCLALYYRKG